MNRLLVPSAALFWGLQFAFLNPALALLLVALYDADARQVGLVLALYNVGGFAASLLVPAYADRRGDYLRPMLGCGVMTVALAVVLGLSRSLPLAVVALVVLGGPAGVGNSLLFAHLRHSGASSSDVIGTRAIASFAWVAGPPVATLVIGAFGDRAVLVPLAVVAALTVGTATLMLRADRSRTPGTRSGAADDHEPTTRAAVAGIVVAFVLLQATNSAAVSVMSLFTTRDLGLPVAWAGAALGLAAGLEIPALLLVARLTKRFTNFALLVAGCLAGIAYYAAMTFVGGPVTLLCAQALNACFFAVVAGVGLTLFQQVIPRPGLASGLYVNTRRVGAVISGPLIAFGAGTSRGYGGIYAVCAVLTALSLVTVLVLRRGRRPTATAG
ncbi:MFS transporter [Kineococcus sp. NBC_00420]|uniref:MFS transporter n=1 Tax=unclassified Kineococcus TaxID=2621656 RepID=UPI002E1FABC5